MGKKRRVEPLLQVRGFRTVAQTGRNTVLEYGGGSVKEAVHALRDQIKARNEDDFCGIVIRGLSRRYDLLYELRREPQKDGRKATVVKFSCWRAQTVQEPSSPTRELTGRERVPTTVPGIWRVATGFRVKVGDVYLGTFATLPEACHAKAMYILEHDRRHPGRKASLGKDANWYLNTLVNQSVRS
jgi:hypothetical protein